MKIFWLIIPVAYLIQILHVIAIAIAKQGRASIEPFFLTREALASLFVSTIAIFCIYMFMR